MKLDFSHVHLLLIFSSVKKTITIILDKYYQKSIWFGSRRIGARVFFGNKNSFKFIGFDGRRFARQHNGCFLCEMKSI